MIKILIVDDSLTSREYLKSLFDADGEFEVVATARDGQEAVSLVERCRPDVITMDIHMPRMDGYEATRQIMMTHPAPIVIVSAGWDSERVENTFHALGAGAVTAIEKPRGPGHPDSRQMAAKLVQTVKLMSEIKVVKRLARQGVPQVGPTARPGPLRRGEGPAASGRQDPARRHQPELVAIGASTGGPPVIQTILSGLGKEFPIPILIVQHIAAGFLEGFAEWLAKTIGLGVRIPSHGERIAGGKVYFAPDGFHMGITHRGEIDLNGGEPEYGLRPAASYLFRSVAGTYGARAVGILLTGMGRDGAAELKAMKQTGAVTIAQDRLTCAVFGMPGEAIKIGAVDHVLSPSAIAEFLDSWIREAR